MLHVPHTPAEYLGGEGALGDDLLNTTPRLGRRELQHSTCLFLISNVNPIAFLVLQLAISIYISLSISMYLPMYYLDPGLLKDGSDSAGHDVVGVRGGGGGRDKQQLSSLIL